MGEFSYKNVYAVDRSFYPSFSFKKCLIHQQRVVPCRQSCLFTVLLTSNFPSYQSYRDEAITYNVKPPAKWDIVIAPCARKHLLSQWSDLDVLLFCKQVKNDCFALRKLAHAIYRDFSELKVINCIGFFFYNFNMLNLCFGKIKKGKTQFYR